MKTLVRLGLTTGLIMLTSMALVRPAAAASALTTCSASLTIFTTSTGTVTIKGPVEHVRDSGVGGQYTAGVLAGYTLSGAQDIVINTVTNQSQLHGSYTATGPGGSLVIRYTGHADLSSGRATGHFETAGGTGQFASFHWAGDISAQLVSLTPPTFLAMDDGPCEGAS